MKSLFLSLALCLTLTGVVAAQCTTTIAAPATENFDAATIASTFSCTSFANPGAFPMGWVLDMTQTSPWTIETANTGSFNTGPTADHTSGSGNYVYLETSGSCVVGNTAILESPCYDVTGLPNNPNLDFWYHMWGSDIGTLQVESWNGIGWIPVFTRTGDQGAGDTWLNAQVGLFTFMDAGLSKARVRFIATHTGTGFEGDIAIDDITVQDGPLAPPLVEWQLNQSQLSIDFDGVEANAITPAVQSKTVFLCGGPPIPATGTFSIESNLPGSFYDLAISAVPLVGGFSGGVALPDGQFVNIDLSQPFTQVGGTSPLQLPGPGFPGVTSVEISGQWAQSTAGTISLQGVIVDSASLLGFRLSQGNQVDITTSGPVASVAGPVATTANVSIDVTQAPTCWSTGIPFYGTVFNTINVSTNGYVSFGGLDTDTTPSILDATNDDGRVGFWTNFDASEGGTITVTTPMPNVVRVDYSGVFYDAGGPGNTFSISFDGTSGNITLDGLQGLMANAGTATTDDQWLGISPGITFPGTTPTDPGAAAFGLGASGFAAMPTDMLYEFNDTSLSLQGLPASVMGGMNTLIFVPDGLGNYLWMGS